MINGKKIAVVMPAYNAEKTLERTVRELPPEVDIKILVDDSSKDRTAALSEQLGVLTFVHSSNFGYGRNQQTCYREALAAGADIVVMVHPDYQYDPKLLPEIIKPIEEDRADVVLGSRLLGGDVMRQGMPWWKFLANRFLTGIENLVFGLHLAEYHTGYRAYRRQALEAVNVEMNSDKFVFDQEIVAQFVDVGMRIAEIPVPTRYFPQASSCSFMSSCRYGFSILGVLTRYVLHRSKLVRQKQFQSLRKRYSAL
jgi:glycosyltransferase involved in cell wall biosynthesis